MVFATAWLSLLRYSAAVTSLPVIIPAKDYDRWLKAEPDRPPVERRLHRSDAHSIA
jgi:hypothetical protein